MDSTAYKLDVFFFSPAGSFEPLASGHWDNDEIVLEPATAVPPEIVTDFLEAHHMEFRRGRRASGSWVWMAAGSLYHVAYARLR